MRRYILTGTPGCGKTTVIERLAAQGRLTVAEAATDVIARSHVRGVEEPWRSLTFIEEIVALQRERRLRAPPAGATGPQFHDRSAICTKALCAHLGYPEPETLAAEIAEILAGGVFEPQVFFLANLGFVEPTAARRISFADALAFEAVHVRTYRELGFELIDVEPTSAEERTRRILAAAAP